MAKKMPQSPGGQGNAQIKTSSRGGATIKKAGQQPGTKYGQNPNAGQKGGK